MTLVMKPRQAKVLHALLNMSAVKGAPMDPDCLSCEDMALEYLKGRGIDIDKDELTKIVHRLWVSLDGRHGL